LETSKSVKIKCQSYFGEPRDIIIWSHQDDKIRICIDKPSKTTRAKNQIVLDFADLKAAIAELEK